MLMCVDGWSDKMSTARAAGNYAVKRTSEKTAAASAASAAKTTAKHSVGNDISVTQKTRRRR